MNYKVAQKKFTKDWEREGTPQMVEFLNDRFRSSSNDDFLQSL